MARFRVDNGAGMTELLSIILAAGEGTRMRSAVPKVLHPVGGLAMVSHAVRAAGGSGTLAEVIGPGQEKSAAAMAAAATKAQTYVQAERRGTAHAVRQAEAAIAKASGNVIVLYADTPLVTSSTVSAIAERLDAGAD